MRTLVACVVAALSVPVLAAEAPAGFADYRAEARVDGVIRVRGSDRMARLVTLWAAGFRRHHPEAKVEATLKGNASAMGGLEEGTADLVVMSRRIVPYDIYGVWRRSHREPIEITVGTGSFDAPSKSYALALLVHASNPVDRLTLAQLDGIFGAHRTGGWDWMAWSKKAARGPEKDLRTWGRLGLQGDWAQRAIRPYGPPGIAPGGMTFFQTRVMQGGDTWAPRLLEFEDRAAMVRALDADPSGIAVAGMQFRTAHVKPVAIAETSAGPYVLPSRETVRDGSYPLARSLYVYLPPDSAAGEDLVPPVAPKVREFLRYVLSREGQADVEREGDYLPLTPDVAAAQRKKLD